MYQSLFVINNNEFYSLHGILNEFKRFAKNKQERLVFTYWMKHNKQQSSMKKQF